MGQMNNGMKEEKFECTVKNDMCRLVLAKKNYRKGEEQDVAERS